ncbi:MAG: VWA domain-containing protein [Chlorobiaceae bacterium]|nr:VWA domain-containing protein [Chlorobiaceae bacterium]
MDELRVLVSGLGFANPWWLLLLPLLAAIEGGKRLAGRKRRPGVLFPGVGRLRREGLAVHPFMSMLPDALRWAALAAGVLALAGPRAPVPPSMLSSSGIDIMLALDVSESMRQQDFDGKSRFDAARDAAREFVKKRNADRIGLLVFSSGGFTRCPLTLDHEVLVRLIDTTEPGFIQEQGTAIGTAVLTATNRLKASESKEKVLVLITDGESNTGEVGPATAAMLAARNGVRIYTVFAGRQGTAVRVENSAATTTPSRQGREELVEVSRVSGGRMFAADDPVGMDRTFRDIDRLEKKRLQGRRPPRTAELYPWLLMAAGVMLVLDTALSSTRFVRIP